MPLPAFADLDLRLAWRRAQLDRPDRCFTTHPRLFDWIAQDEAAWLRGIQEELASGYSPRPSTLCWSAKPGGLGRPGRVVELKDEVVFNALVGAAYPHIWIALQN